MFGDRKTVQDIADMARDKLRSYGFRCDNMKLSLVVERHATETSGRVSVEFDAESATGMAAFSQHMVTPGVKFFLEQVGGMDPEKTGGWQGDKVDSDALRGVGVNLMVHYSHHAGGTNGIDRYYTVHPQGERLVESG